MIEGLHVDVSGVEMKKLYESRAEYHSKKAAKLEAEFGKAKRLDDDFDDEAELLGKISNTNNLANSVELRLRQARGQALYFAFAAEHVNVHETYRLSRDDLYVLGVAPRGY